MKTYIFNPGYFRVLLRSVIAPAMQIQITLCLGFLVTTIVSLYYQNSPHAYPPENPKLALAMTVLSGIIAIAGYLIQKYDPPKAKISLRRGAWVVLVTWLISILLSGLFFILNGVPAPQFASEISLTSRWIDAIYESLSGFTTTGATILPSVEVFPRSMLFWRALTHWLGGMGIAYLGVTIWKTFKSSREAIINSESEGPNTVSFETNEQARTSGIDFLKAYSILTAVLFILLIISGIFFRTTPYKSWSDNVFDSAVHTFSVIGTGGFSNYDKSAGIPNEATEKYIIAGGLQNTTSEWILAIFMAFAGMNFGLWYILLFEKNKLSVFKNRELQAYAGIIGISTCLIVFFLHNQGFYNTLEQTWRYAFFNVTTIISTTGLGNWDFINWPSEALGILFVCFLVGGMVGSTAGGPKVARFVIAYKYIKQQIHNFIYGTSKDTFEIDGVTYDHSKAGLVLANTSLYYLIFLLGGILLLVFSYDGISYLTGQSARLDFGTAMAASIANLGNIGPGINITQGFNIGPTGNYSLFTNAGKIILMLLMYIGRVGVLTCIMLAMRTKGEYRLLTSVSKIKFSETSPSLHQ